MSQFLAIVTQAPHHDALDRWLSSANAEPNEVHRVSLGGGSRLTIVARDVRRGLTQNRFFAGIAIDPQRHEAGFGAAGWRRMRACEDERAHLGGGFIDISWSPTGVRFRRDTAGSLALLHTRGDGWWAFSDSLLLLVSLRRAMGEPVTPHREALLARTRTLALTTQGFSPDTIVSEVRFSPRGAAPRLVRDDPRTDFHLVTVDDEIHRDVVSTAREYRREVRSLAANIVAQAELPLRGVQVNLALSGGADSRLVLAAYRRAGRLGGIRVFSHEHAPSNRPDHALAASLAEAIGFPLSPPLTFRAGPTRTFHASGAPLWASSHLGVYDRFMPGRTGTQVGTRLVRTAGTGAGVLKGAYGWRTLAQLERLYHVERPDAGADAAERRGALMSQLDAGMRAARIDPRAWNASEQHYATYRNGLHGGSHSVQSLLAIQLLQQPAMIRMAHTPHLLSPDPRLHPRHGISDLLALVDPELARLPFLDASNDRTPSDIADQQRLYGGPLRDDEIPRYRVWGRPADAIAGPSAFGIRIAERSGFDIDPTPEGILARADEIAAQTITEGVFDRAHAHLRRVAVSALVKQGIPARSAGPSVAKLLTPALFLV